MTAPAVTLLGCTVKASCTGAGGSVITGAGGSLIPFVIPSVQATRAIPPTHTNHPLHARDIVPPRAAAAAAHEWCDARFTLRGAVYPAAAPLCYAACVDAGGRPEGPPSALRLPWRPPDPA